MCCHLNLCVWAVWDLRSSVMLHNADWQLVTDVLEQPISHIFKGQAAQE